MPTITGTIAAGRVRGRAPATPQARPCGGGLDWPLGGRRGGFRHRRSAFHARPVPPDSDRRCPSCVAVRWPPAAPTSSTALPAHLGRRRRRSCPSIPGSPPAAVERLLDVAAPGRPDRRPRPGTRLDRRPPGRATATPSWCATSGTHRHPEGRRPHPRLRGRLGPGHQRPPRGRPEPRPVAVLPPALPRRRPLGGHAGRCITGTPLEVHDALRRRRRDRRGRPRAPPSRPLVPTALARIDPRIFRRLVVGGAVAARPVPPNAVVSYGIDRDRQRVSSTTGVAARRRRGPHRRTARSRCGATMLLRAYRDGTDPPRRRTAGCPTGDAGELSRGRPPRRARPSRRPDHHRRRERVARSRSSGCSAAPRSGRRGGGDRAARSGVGPAGRRRRGAVDPTGPPTLDELRDACEGGAAGLRRPPRARADRRAAPHQLGKVARKSL